MADNGNGKSKATSLTTRNRVAKNGIQSRIDSNREKRLRAVRELERLLVLATNSEFSGSIGVEIHSKGGILQRVKSSFASYEN